MKIHVVKFSPPAFRETKELARTYAERLSSQVSFELKELKDPTSAKERRRAAARSPEKDPTHYWIGLDEAGASWTSNELAHRLGKLRDDPRHKSLWFFIGGPYGLPEPYREKADALWSLSPLTLPGDLAWVVCVEQIYRGFQILSGSPYHHG